MFDSSPIAVWEGAAAFFVFAGSGFVVFWFWVMVLLCLVPVWVSLKAESTVEKKLNDG